TPANAVAGLHDAAVGQLVQPGAVVSGREHDARPSTRAECAVERAGGGVAIHAEAGGVAAPEQDLAIRLQDQAPVPEAGHGHLAAGCEARVESPVYVVTDDHGCLRARRVEIQASGEQLAVGLDGQV